VEEIWQVIHTIKHSGMATLIVDRDYHKVLQHSDRALVMQKGQIVLQGAADQVAIDPELPSYLGV
jgi:branched-chain amino acid transport system ATP-binding protein